MPTYAQVLRKLAGWAQVAFAGLWVGCLLIAVTGLVLWSVLEDWLKGARDVE